MPLMLDHQLRERMEHDASAFPISYYENELAALPNRAVPPHWHPELEFVTAVREPLDFRIGLEQFRLFEGESIFINSNMLHGIRQSSDGEWEPMPNVVFDGKLIAPESSSIYQKYILPILRCEGLPYVVFRQENTWQAEANRLLQEIYRSLKDREDCHEMTVQRHLSRIFELMHRNFDHIPRHEITRVQLAAQIRIQKMQEYIHQHYAESITLDDISAAASISRSEANRCFHAYTGVSPIEALIQHRLGVAHRLLHETTLPLREISRMCGFNSESYFYRRFRKAYGCSPCSFRSLGK